MKINWNLNKKKKLAVFWHSEKFEFYQFDQSGISKLQSLGNISPSETLLVMDRSGVIQKEMSLSGAGNIKENFESALSELLPAHKEMAYGRLPWDSALNGKGLLYAIPEKKIKEMLDSLVHLGVCPDEVVTEDQCLSWLFQDHNISPSPFLVVDKTKDRVLFTAIQNKNVVFSGAYPNAHESYENIFSEMSFSLLQINFKPEKIILSGMDEEEKIKAAGFFEAPIAFLGNGAGEWPASVSGLKFWGKFPCASLLPKELKIIKWRKNQKERFRGFVLGLLFLVAALVLFGTSHLMVVEHRAATIDRETQKILPEVNHLRRVSASLNKIKRGDDSKVRVLRLFAELAQRISPSIRLKELQADEKDIIFQGESPSHTFVSDTAQEIEKMEGVREVKIEHTRMRKRLNQDYLEFEITAKWKGPNE